MAAPSLKIPLSLDMDAFKKGINDAKSATSEVTQFIVKKFVDMNAAALVASGATGGAVVAARSLLGTLGFIGGGITAIVASFELMSYATELAKEKIEEFNKIASQAGQAGVSNDFFQRWVQGGQQLKLSVDDATEALNHFQQQSKDALGGSQLQQEITKLTDAGNFKGNTGVAALGLSNDTQQKLQAAVSLIDQALDSGQRLAGLDLANKLFGPKVAENAAADSGYLDKMLATANSISASKIISDEQIGQAITLKTQLEDAQKVLAEKWKPIQDDLAKLGMNYQQSWVDIYTNIATAVGYADQLYEALGRIPAALAQAGSSPFWAKLTEISGALGLNSSDADLGIIQKGQPGFDSTSAGSPAFNALRSGLQNPAAVQQAMKLTTTVQSQVRGDKSKDPNAQDDDTDAVDRAIDALNKHNLATQADADAVGKGAAALAEFRAQAAENAAIQKNGGDITAEQAAQFDKLRAAAAAAAQALAVAQVNSTISRGQQTAFFTPEDLAIANQLKGIYGNDIPAAMQSSYAASLRFNSTIQQLGQLGQQVNSGFLVDFETQIRNGASAMAALQTAGVNALGKIADKLASMAADNLWSSAFGGSTGGAGSFFSNIFGGGSGAVNANGSITGAVGPTSVGGAALVTAAVGGLIRGPGSPISDSIPARLSDGEYVINAKAASQYKDVLDSINSGRGYANGGPVGNIVPNDITPSGGGGGITVHTGSPITIQGSADQTTLVLMQQALAKCDAELPSRVIHAVTMAKKQRKLS